MIEAADNNSSLMKLAVESLRNWPAACMHDRTDVTRIQGRSGTYGDWEALGKVAGVIEDAAGEAASLGIGGLSFTLLCEEDLTLDHPVPGQDEIIVTVEWRAPRWNDGELLDNASASVRIYGHDAFWDRYRIRYRHGAVDAMANLMGKMYDRVTSPHKVGRFGTDFATIRWLPWGFDPEEHDCRKMADALDAGVPYEDVFGS